MTDDLVKRLRVWGSDARDKPPIELLHEAADEIERLRAAMLLTAERAMGQEPNAVSQEEGP